MDGKVYLSFDLLVCRVEVENGLRKDVVGIGRALHDMEIEDEEERADSFASLGGHWQSLRCAFVRRNVSRLCLI